MRIAVMGAGAVGAYFGAKLSASGHNVAFLARGAHLDELRREGLRVDSPAGDLRIRNALFTNDPGETAAVDLILFCVKSYDTDAAVDALAPMIGRATTILSLQNGVDNADKIVAHWGETRTLAGVVYLGAQLVRPGTIKHSAGGRIVFGELDGSVRVTTQSIEQALTAAQIPCEISKDIRKAQWRKLLWNAPFCAISCLTRTTVKEIIESDSLCQLAVDCMAEVRQAARTQSVDLEPELLDETLTFSKTLGDFKPSMLQDLEARKPLEFEAFNGSVVKLLRQAGQAAPVNQVFYGTLEYLDKKIRREAAG
ncbi:MAG: 2-dehydropantoate 2-reductase [Deltaproteobacteria bacterium]|nr:2-dehydropantoate 2-reductase [Deltaproteobacteria bacterium]MDZ4343079.1 2-dehydropantoate 2-reductase [Candidatus Binatia bacterium]